MIRHIKHNDINKTKWDNCIEKSFNKTVFAFSWYLDIVSPGWDALIDDDYASVMPLTHRRKCGVAYICQPILCQQLGVFSNRHVKDFNVDDFILAIPSKFKLIEIALNTQNTIDQLPKNGILKEGTNYELALNKYYDELVANYEKSHIKNIRKVLNQNVTIETGNNLLDVFLQYKTETISNKKIKFTRNDKDSYSKLLKTFNNNNTLKIYIAKNDKNNILGGICFFLAGNKVMFQSFTNDLGKKMSIGYFLIDLFIQEHAGQNLILDFMGSNIETIAYRNEGFGSKKTAYHLVKIIRVPEFFIYLKRLIGK